MIGFLVLKRQVQIDVMTRKIFLKKNRRSILVEEISLGSNDKLLKLIFKGRTLPCLHSDGFIKPTQEHPYTIVRFPV